MRDLNHILRFWFKKQDDSSFQNILWKALRIIKILSYLYYAETWKQIPELKVQILYAYRI
jgi:hypothetical protein